MAVSARPAGRARPLRVAPSAVAGRSAGIVCAALLLFSAFAYLPLLRVPFIGDDYVFLDKTRVAGLGDLFSRRNTDFGWYRPWSREVHFFVLQRLFGAR